MSDEIKLGDLGFTPMDLVFLDMSEPSSTTRYGLTEYQSKYLAKEINRILREKLAKAPRMYSALQELNPDEADWEPLMDFNERKETPTHIARIVCIGEIKSE